MDTTLRIASRQSALALWQTEHVAARLRDAWPDLQIEIVGITTQGDRIIDTPLAAIGGKGLFIKELEQALCDGRADIAVHSMKDVGHHFPDGLGITTILAREDPRDAFISDHYETPADLPNDARVGTCSLRRQCQLAAAYPTIKLANLRGNVNTRLGKLDAGDYDAIILAEAGLIRLGIDRRRTILETGNSLPAMGQGAIGIEGKLDDTATLALLEPLHDADTACRLRAERAFGARLQASCQLPVAGFAELDNGMLRLRGLVGLPDGSCIVKGELHGPSEAAKALGEQLADDILSRGADEILRLVNDSPDPS